MPAYRAPILSTDRARASATTDHPAIDDDSNAGGRPSSVYSRAGGGRLDSERPTPASRAQDDYRRLSPPAVVMVMCDIVVFALAPCQCRSPALICTTSPTLISRSSCSVATMPLPPVTTRI